MSERDAILGALAEARAVEAPEAFRQAAPDLPEIDLWASFQGRLSELGGRLVGPDELESLRRKPAVSDDALVNLAKRIGLEIVSDPWEAEVGVTQGDLAIAETGSVLVSCGSGRSRMASLAPPVHLVVMPRDAIVRSFEEAFERLADRTSVIITGPSRTADIEGVLVRGVHGPREVWVLPIEP